MIGGWFVGDIAKTTFYIMKKLPLPFWFGGCFAVVVDLLVLCQYFWYGDGGSRGEVDSYRGSEVEEEVGVEGKTASL